MKHKTIKIIGIVAACVVALGLIWALTKNVHGPQETRSWQEQDESIHDTMTKSLPDLSDPEAMGQFKSTANMIEGTVGY